jgi:hypothetical protein
MTGKRPKRPQQIDEQRYRMIGRLRIGDLNKLFAYRYRGTRESWQFSDDDAGREDLEIILHHYSVSNPLRMRKIIKLRAPWMEIDEVLRLLEQVEACPRLWRAGALGQELNFTGAEWRVLRLRTITPIDMTKDERRAFSRALYQQRRQAKRRAEGKKSRAEYEASSLSRTKPWEAEGISRRTWERRRRACRKSGCNKDILKAIHTLASEQAAAPQRGWPSEAVSSGNTKARSPRDRVRRPDEHHAGMPRPTPVMEPAS